jgi:hypothetical protein
MPIDRNRVLASHLRAMAVFEKTGRYHARRILLRHGRLAAKAFADDGKDGVQIALWKGEKDHREFLVRFSNSVASRFSKRVFDKFKTPQFDYELALIEFIERHALEDAALIHGATKAQIATVIRMGEKEGASVQAISKLIREQSISLSRTRAITIARTETHNAASFASQAAARSTGLRLEKEWLAASDDRTRDGHAEADGQRQPMNEPYLVPGFDGTPSARMMRPGDRGAPGGQVINCRCAEIYHKN